MNYDIALCLGEGCTKRDNCHRHQAYIYVPTAELPYCYFCDPCECMKENHKLYWEEKND